MSQTIIKNAINPKQDIFRKLFPKVKQIKGEGGNIQMEDVLKYMTLRNDEQPTRQPGRDNRKHSTYQVVSMKE